MEPKKVIKEKYTISISKKEIRALFGIPDNAKNVSISAKSPISFLNIGDYVKDDYEIEWEIERKE